MKGERIGTKVFTSCISKYKDPNTKKADYLWLKECFEEEMKGFQIKKNAGKKIPDNYLFFTMCKSAPYYQGIVFIESFCRRAQ